MSGCGASEGCTSDNEGETSDGIVAPGGVDLLLVLDEDEEETAVSAAVAPFVA